MDIIEQQLLAYNARDLQRFIATYSPEIVIEDGSNNVMMRGHDQMRERYGTMFNANPELHCEIVNRICIGSYTIDEERITGRGPDPQNAVVIYRVEGEKIVHVRILR